MKRKLLLFMGIVVLFFFVLPINSTKAASYKKYTGTYKGTWKTYDITCQGIYKKKHKTSKVILKVKRDGSLTGKWKVKGGSYKKINGQMKKKNIRLHYLNLSTTYDFIGTIKNGKLKVIAFNNDASSKRRCLLGWKENIVAKKKLTISDPTLTLSKIYDGTTTAQVTAGSLIGVIGSNNVTVSATATYDNADVGTGKTITVVYTLAGTDAPNYIKPVNYTVATGEITNAPINMAIGDYYQGGKIAYLDGTGHGFISALSDQGSSTWGVAPCYGSDIIGASGTAIGTGLQNTIDMVAVPSCTGAAQLTYGVTINGYNDWYLPSKDELNQLYINKVAIGGFTSNYYWSSSENSTSYAWMQSFNTGNQFSHYKDETYYVRAIRAF
ncbi:MAG: YDG domain-containing protein [Patescibacteria group bacterium]|nr:YDG domain-containing protein [Patescibacteria group bacterium]